MSTVSSRSLRRPARSVAAGPVAAGFRPASAALAIAAAFSLQPVPLHAQPAGAQVVHGAASFARSGSNLLVTTQNGAGTAHSTINWQSFSVPAGSVTQFQQPSATSTSINRVTGHDPSAIFGTLSSNGRLVLVNPAGIAVGKGALVDTAAFTASTLRMSDADALASRMLFTAGGADLQVDGQVVARSGDVVLIAPRVLAGAAALIQSQGATVLAAGQTVEITGRGLEGIRLHVTAPGNEAVNLGTLSGDAVGIFAGTLRHSGAIHASAVSAAGGRVVLRAAGDNLVSGSIAAVQGDRGGSIDVLGQRVGLLAGATLRASGDSGGGQVRIGGDHQGLNAEVPNASHTHVDAQARIEANAGSAGDGGRVIVWADGTTRMHGRIAARGGAAGGNGGFAEVSGKQYLEYTGRVDLRAPNGNAGALLLDPNDIEIWSGGPTQTTTANSVFAGGGGTTRINVSDLTDQLNLANVQVNTSPGSSGPNGGSITLMSGADVNWTAATTLSLQADAFIELRGSVKNQTAGSALHMKALNGNVSQTGTASVIEIPQLYAGANNGQVLLNGANRVGLLAGEAYGPGARFEFTNAQQLRIGTVMTPYGGRSGGINVNDSDTVSVALVRTTAGNLVVGGGGGVRAGTVTLSAAGAADDVLIDNAQVYASNGTASVTAGRDVGISITEAGNGYVSSQQSTLITAGRDVLVGTVAFGTGYASAQVNSNSLVRIQAGRDAVFGADTSSPYYARGNVYGGGSGGAGNGISISAGNNVDFRQYSYVRAYQSPISVLANNSILGFGDFYAGGGLAGTVELTATNGSLNFRQVNSYGSYSGMGGGRVRLQARGDITGGRIHAYGASSGSSLGSGAGGLVEVTSHAGNIRISTLDARGGDFYSYSSGSAPGGAGGAAVLKALAGSIVVDAAINVGGGSGEGGGAGGSVDVVAAHNVAVPHIFAEGGYSVTGQTPAGQGGNVRVQAGGDITLRGTNYYETPITVNGGIGGDSGVGGNAGTIWLKAGGNIVARTEGMTDEYLITAASEGPSLVAGLSAAGGYGNGGGRGGGITVEAGGNLDAGALFADGGSGFGHPDAPGAQGGQGGTVDVRFGGITAVDGLIATGGYGADGTSGGAGGRGGAISFGRTAGNLTIGSTPHFSASGGAGGNALTETGMRGLGGHGGSVVLGSAGGTLTLQGPSVFVNGGLDGLRPGETRPEPPAISPAGLPGNFSALAARVDVVGGMRVEGGWNNPAGTVVNFGDGASLQARGFTNHGQLNVFGSGDLHAAGPVANMAGGRLAIQSGDHAMAVVGNAGMLDIAAGAKLATPVFRNEATGTVLVNGTLDFTTCVTCAISAITFNGPAFLNEGLLAGSGQVIVAGGAGVVKNSGTIAPGGLGTVGTLTLTSNLAMEPGSTLALDVSSATSFDVLKVAGSISAGGTVDVASPPASVPPGSTLDILQAPVIDLSTPPTLKTNNPDLQLALTATGIKVTAPVPAPPPPPPAPPTPPPPPPPVSTTGEPAKQVAGQVVTFAQLFIQEAAEQQREEAKKNEVGKDDITVTGTACTP